MKSLSRRITEKMKRCGLCHGKGWYYAKGVKRKFGKLSCPNCRDCPVCLRTIRKLEAVARAASKLMENAPMLIHRHGNDAVSLRKALARLEAK